MTSEFRWKAIIHTIFILVVLGAGAYLHATDNRLIIFVYITLFMMAFYGLVQFYNWIYLRLIDPDARPDDAYYFDDSRYFAMPAVFLTFYALLRLHPYPLIGIPILLAILWVRMWFIRRRMR